MYEMRSHHVDGREELVDEMRTIEMKVVTSWQCDHCDETFDSERLCELHEKVFCERNPELKEYIKSKVGRWFMNKGEIRKIAGYDYEFGDFVASCYLNGMEFVVYPKKDFCDGLLTTHKWVDESEEISEKAAYSTLRDGVMGMIEESMKDMVYVGKKQ